MIRPVIGTQRNAPPFRYDIVGSFLRTDEIKAARLQYDNGEITGSQLHEIENIEIAKLLELQKKWVYWRSQTGNFAVPGGISISL